MEKRNCTIDALKGIGMFGIILTHFCQVFPVKLSIVEYGARGVQLMYVITGYLTIASFSRNSTLSVWYKKKIIRIIPMYWLFTIINLLIIPEGNTYWLGKLEKLSSLNIISNMLCLHGFVPYYINSINLNWYIANIMVWFLIVPIIMKYLNNIKKCICTFIIYIPIFIMFCQILTYFELDYVVSQYFTYLWLPAQFPCILLGMIIYYALQNSNDNVDKKLINVCTIAIIMICFEICLFYINVNVFNETITWGILFALLLGLLLQSPVKIICNKIFATFGKYSLGIYLSHISILTIISKIFEKRGVIITGYKFKILLYISVCIISFVISASTEIIQNKLIDKLHKK